MLSSQASARSYLPSGVTDHTYEVLGIPGTAQCIHRDAAITVY